MKIKLYLLLCFFNSAISIAHYRPKNEVVAKTCKEFNIQHREGLIQRVKTVNNDILKNGIKKNPQDDDSLLTRHTYGKLTLKVTRSKQQFKPFLAHIACLDAVQKNEFAWLQSEGEQPSHYMPEFCLENKVFFEKIKADSFSSPNNLSPVMGWNSYNCFGATVREKEVKANADFMAANLSRFGWEYIVVDYCWFYPHHPKSIQDNPPQFRLPVDSGYVPWLAMDSFGRLLPDPSKFPSSVQNGGFKSLADYIHNLGLKFGIHLMRGIPRQAVWDRSPVKGENGIDASMIADTNSTCAWLNNMYGLDMSKKGAQTYLNSLFELYANWGVDFVKIDDLSLPYYAREIEGYKKAIESCGREIILSTSPGATPLSMGNHIKNFANQWRVADDFWDNWDGLYKMFDYANAWTYYRSPGHWPDLDMLQLGRLSRRGPDGKERETRFTKEEQRTHFTLWSIAQSPLIFGGDLSVIDSSTLKLITNDEVISVNQNSYEPRQLYRKDNVVVWVSKIKESNIYNVAFFNLSDKPKMVTIKFNDIDIAGQVKIRNLMEKTELGKFKIQFSTNINSHDAGLYQIHY